MRVLCLHPAASSALQFSQELHKLEDRLWNKHGIELVFIDGPLMDVQPGNAVGEEGGGVLALEQSSCGDANDFERVSRRRWYVAELSTRSALPLPSFEQPITTTTTTAAATSTSTTTTTTATTTAGAKIQYSGLDASLLHVSQIWSRGGVNVISNNNLAECMPFQGVLGYGQGADVAALLPLLHRHVYDDDDDDDSGDEGKANNSATKPIKREAITFTMFEGLQFVILIDGKDILLQSMNDDDKIDSNHVEDESIENNYVGPDGVHSLHVILEGNDIHDPEDHGTQKHNSSERLAKRYGPNATIHKCTSEHPSTSNSTSSSLSSALFNIIGKFLVTQKNKLYTSSKTRELMLLQHQLLNVEQLATIAISEEIQRNPPNALMAVIGPSVRTSVAASSGNTDMTNGTLEDDSELNQQRHHKQQQQQQQQQQQKANEIVNVVDKAVGAWQGGRRRGFGEEGGGAPCPEEFLLREKERLDILRLAAHDYETTGKDSVDDDIPILQNLDENTAISPKQISKNHLPPVPVTILTGFLGSGKSTLVRHILTSSTHQKRIAVIENEFGGGDNVDIAQRIGMTMNYDASTLSVETMIVKDGTDGSSLADYIELPNGCVCCTVKDSLVETLEALLTKRSDLDYIIIEASGMADPGPVASIFWLDEALNSRLRLDGIITCVDAKNIAFQLESTSSAPSGVSGGGGGDEAARQIAFADRIILNKVDLLQCGQESDGIESYVESVLQQIQSINPTAPVKSTIYSKIEDLDWILDANCFDAERAKEVDSAFQFVVDDKALGTIDFGENAELKQNETKCDRGCCSKNHPPNDLCGLCSTVPHLSSPTFNLHRHTNAVGTIALFGCGSVDLHRVHSWLASILWPNQDESDKILRARLEGSYLYQDENDLQNTKDDVDSRVQMIYRVKGILSVGHAMDKTGKIIPASNDWVDDGIVAGVIDSIDGSDKRKFILQAVHDLWDIFPASENLNWEPSETRCCKVIVIGKYLERVGLQDGFNACFNH